jgi:hypothetical protein
MRGGGIIPLPLEGLDLEFIFFVDVVSVWKLHQII